EKAGEDLRDLLLVAPHHACRRRMIPIDGTVATSLEDAQRDVIGLAARVGNRDLQRLARVEATDDDLESTALERRELEQIADQTEELLSRRFDLAEGLLLPVRDRTAEPLLHQRDVADHGGEWRAQLVGNVREELVLDATRFEERHVLPLELGVGLYECG